MYETTVKILKILYQTRITKENLASNLNLKENTITKSIIEINNLLEQLNLNKIQIYEKNLQLNLLKSEWQKVFKNLNSLTFDERVDYLYIKFIYFKFINLEKEKVELNLSRSSIDRCFLVVKKMLKKNGSKLSYNKEKENILIDISQYDKKIFVIKITKLILEEEILIEAQKKLLNNMKNFVLKIRIAELISIYKCLKFPTTAILLSFLCALNIYIDRFREEFINLDDKDIKSNKLLKKIENIVNYIGYSFNERYKKFLIYYINEISSNKYYFFEETYSKANIILEKLTNRFGIEDEKFKNYILQYLYLGILKKENNILKIRNVYFYYDENILLNILNPILENHYVELYMCDKYRIINLLKNKIFEINLAKSTEVLILLQDINLSRQIILKEELENNFTNINFDIEYSFFKYKNLNKKYDYVIDDLDINLGRGDIFDRVKNKLLSLTIEKSIQNYDKK